MISHTAVIKCDALGCLEDQARSQYHREVRKRGALYGLARIEMEWLYRKNVLET